MDISDDLLFQVNDIWNQFDEKYLTKYPSDFLYHYTGYSQAITGIVEKKKLWLSPYNDVNDPSEVSHGMELAFSIADQFRVQKTKTADIKSYDFLIDLIDHFRSFSVHEFFFICFTEAGDKDIAQWREYGNRGNGFCIEFLSRNAFYDPNRKQDLVFAKTHLLQVRPVVYDDATKNQLLNLYFQNFDNFIVSSGPGGAHLVVSFLRQLCIYFKHQAYAPEKEWRTVVISKSNKVFLSTGSIEVVDLGGQFRKKLIIDVPAQKEDLDGINRIVCGPKQNLSKFSATEKYVNDLQVTSTHKIQVEPSDVPMI